MNNKTKGNNAERIAKDLLESNGYLVMRSPRTSKKIIVHGKTIFVSQANDFFGLFDLCAKKKYATKWIQVKSNLSDVYKVKSEIADFCEKYSEPLSEHYQVWLRIKNKGFIVYNYDGHGRWSTSKLTLDGKLLNSEKWTLRSEK